MWKNKFYFLKLLPNVNLYKYKKDMNTVDKPHSQRTSSYKDETWDKSSVFLSQMEGQVITAFCCPCASLDVVDHGCAFIITMFCLAYINRIAGVIFPSCKHKLILSVNHFVVINAIDKCFSNDVAFSVNLSLWLSVFCFI